MPYVSDMVAKGTRTTLQRVGVRAMILAVVVAALVAATFAVRGFDEVSAQSDTDCETTDLGTLDSNSHSQLEASGRWTTEDCDSSFISDSDTHYYSFEVIVAGQVRIDLSSEKGDAFLHLLTEDGSRLAHDDDSGPAVDARIEANLDTGIYLIEATAGAGRGRGAADFTLTVNWATNCAPIDLRTVGEETSLSAEGMWAVASCGARFRNDTPAITYKFNLEEEAFVRIELIAPSGGDPYMYLLEEDESFIYGDDDGAGGRNSRIENDLPAGTYLVEATTFGDREHGHELTEFTLTIEIMDEDRHKMKAEELYIPKPVVAGQPVTIQYRVGNAGGTDLPEDLRARAAIYGRGVYRATELIAAADGNWKAGVSHHAGDETAISSSVTHDEIKPFTVTFNGSGDNWAYLSVGTYDEEDERIDLHGFFEEFVVYEGFPIDPMTVRVGGLDYEVSAVADEEGEVTTSVALGIAPDSEVLPEQREKALYTAGVQTQGLEGIFDRPAVASLPSTGEGDPTSVPSPSSRDLMKLFGNQYSTALRDAGMRRSILDGFSVNPIEVEDILLSMAEKASARAVSLVSTWKGLEARIGDASPMSFVDAFALHSQLFYGEKVLAPLIDAGEIVEAARAAETGWEDEGVQGMMEEFGDAYSCRSPASIAVPLRRAELVDLGWMLTADTEMRLALPMYELAADAVLCADGADEENEQFFENLFIGENREFLDLFNIAPPPPRPTPAPYRLRVLSRLGDDGRIEHGVELSNGEQVFPEMRHLAADSEVDEWVITSDVLVEEEVIGQIQSRRLEGGRVEVGYITVTGREVKPRVRYLPDDMPEDVWFRTGNVTATRRAPE